MQAAQQGLADASAREAAAAEVQQSLRDRLVSTEAELEELRHCSAAELSTVQAAAEARLDAVSNNAAELRERAAASQAETAELRARQADSLARVDELSADLLDSRQAVADARQTLSATQAAAETATQDAAGLRRKLAEHDKEAQRASRELDILQVCCLECYLTTQSVVACRVHLGAGRRQGTESLSVTCLCWIPDLYALCCQRAASGAAGCAQSRCVSTL